MTTDPRTWMVLLRDISGTVRVADLPSVVACLVLDAGTGLILGNGMEGDHEAALRRALGTALHRPMAPQPGPPRQIVCAPELADDIRAAIAALAPQRPPDVVGVPIPDEAEDIFDSMVGHLAGRTQPADAPLPADWHAAFAAAHEYVRQTPWQRWHDAVPLRLDVRLDGAQAVYTAVVLGNAGIQHGLGLYPGPFLPAGLGRGDPASTSAPAGALMCFLDPPGELPEDLEAKARRYGWPADAGLIPAFMATDGRGPADPSTTQLHHLTVALAAVTAHDRRGPALVGADGGAATDGEITLGGDEAPRARFHLGVAPDRSGAGAAAGAAGGAADTDGDDATIDGLLQVFLVDQAVRLSERTWRRYVDVVDLLRTFLNGYGHQYLKAADRARWKAAYDAGDEEAFTRLFGAEQIATGLAEFLGYFVPRKVIAGQDLLRATGTVTRKLSRWLAEQGYLDAVTAAAAAERAADAARASRR